MSEVPEIHLDPIACLKDIEAFCKGRMALTKDINSGSFYAYRDVKYLTNQYLKNLKKEEKE